MTKQEMKRKADWQKFRREQIAIARANVTNVIKK